MTIALGLLIVLACALMILAVMIQNSKGGGISSAFGAGAATQILGARRGNELIEKITWGLAISLALLAIGGSLLLGLGTNDDTATLRMGSAIENQVIDNATQMPDASTFDAPVAPAPQE